MSRKAPGLTTAHLPTLSIPALALAAVTALVPWLPAAPPAPTGPGPADSLTLEEVLARHAEASGGRAALDSIRNIDVRFLVIEPEYALEGRYRATRAGRVRVDVFAGPDLVYSEGIDSAGPWKREGPDAPIEALSDAGAAALRHGVTFNLLPLHRYPERGHTLSYRGTERVEGTTYHAVSITLQDGFRARLLLDPETWLIARRHEVRALHPDRGDGETRIETLFRAYGEACGIRRATRTHQVDRTTGDTAQRTRVLEQRCNRPVDSLDLSRAGAP